MLNIAVDAFIVIILTGFTKVYKTDRISLLGAFGNLPNFALFCYYYILNTLAIDTLN